MKRNVSVYLSYLPWVLLVILFGPTIHQLYRSRWEAIDYTHAYFILPVSLWLVWRVRGQLETLYKNSKLSNASLDNVTASSPSPFPLPEGEGGPTFHGQSSKQSFEGRGEGMRSGWLALLIVGVLIFLFGWRNEYLSITTFALIPVLMGLGGYLFGPGVAKALAFPVLYLLFLIPPPLGMLDAVTLPMRYGASVITYKFLHFFHYPIERSGLLFYMGGHEIFIGEPCSGFRSLITLLALGSVFIYITEGRPLKKVLLGASIVPLALIGNIVRIVALCLITYYFGEKVGQGFFHNFSGIVVFLIALFGLMGLEKWLDRRLAK